jgi:uncharacterized phiE125 gp8 family phage protein
MALFLVTPPAKEPLTVAEAKVHLRVDENVADEDDLIASLIVAARQHVETYTHRALCTQTWDDKRDGFPCAIWLPKPPVSAVTSISYVDTSGATQTWAPTNYVTDLPTGPWARAARIVAAYAIPYPVTRSVPNAVTIRFVCGYGAPADVPDAIKAGLKLLIGHWYANREPVNLGTMVTNIPHTVDALLWPFKAF